MQIYYEDDQACLFDPESYAGKTCPEHSPQVSRTVRTSGSSLRRLLKYVYPTYMFLDLTPGNFNLLGGYEWEIRSPWAGELPLLNTGVSPKEEHESSLSQILEDSLHPRYYLSPKACLGILRRAKVRGKPLPKRLEAALLAQAGLSDGEDIDTDIQLARRSAGKSPSKKNAPTGRSRYSSKYALSDRLYCGECGTRYQRCTWRNRDGSKRIVWRCVSRVDYGSKYCHDSPTLDEEPLHRAILAAINSTIKDKDNIVYNLKAAMEKELAPAAGQQLSLSEIDNQLEQLNIEFSKVLAEASESGDQSAYSGRFREIMQKQATLKAQRDEIQRMLAESGKAAAHIEQCRQAAETTPATITEWDEALIRQVVESVTVETGGGIVVALKSGASIHQELM